MDYKIKKLNGKFVVHEKRCNYEVDLRHRLFLFAVNTFKFLDTIPYKKEYEVFRYQLSKSTTSMGANYEEAQGAFSRREFFSKVGICLKEAKESNYFFRIIDFLKIGDSDKKINLLSESDQLQKIFASILLKSRN